MAKKVNSAPTVAAGSFAVSKVNAAHFIVRPANRIGLQCQRSDRWWGRWLLHSFNHL